VGGKDMWAYKEERFMGPRKSVQRKSQKFAVNSSAERQRWRRQFKLPDPNRAELKRKKNEKFSTLSLEN